MKEKLKKLHRRAREWFCWLTCRDLLDAINEGRGEQEIEIILKACVERNFGGKRKCRSRENT